MISINVVVQPCSVRNTSKWQNASFYIRAGAWEKGPDVILHHFVYRPGKVGKCCTLCMQWLIFEWPYLNQFKQFFETVFFFARFVLLSRNRKCKNLTINQKWRQVPFLMSWLIIFWYALYTVTVQYCRSLASNPAPPGSLSYWVAGKGPGGQFK